MMAFEPTDPAMWETIMAPFAGTMPAGEDLRLDVTPHALYSRLRDARAEARAAERMAENDPASGPPASDGWKTVERLAFEALGSRSKDIEIACWLTESLTRRSGLAGLADGAAILEGLISCFWNDGLFPTPDDEDPEGRLVCIGGLSGQDRDGSLMQPLRSITLFEREDGSAFTLWQYEQSRELAALSESARTSQRAASGIVPLVDIEASARSHGRSSLMAVGREAARAAAAWRALEETIAGVASDDVAPATGRLRKLLDGLVKIVERYVPVQEIAPVMPAATAPDDDATAVSRPGRVAATRDGLLDDVLRIAASFRESEPNSPLSYTLEDAVRRARLSWPELLAELMPDLPPRAAVLTGLGIRPPQE